MSAGESYVFVCVRVSNMCQAMICSSNLVCGLRELYLSLFHRVEEFCIYYLITKHANGRCVFPFGRDNLSQGFMQQIPLIEGD